MPHTCINLLAFSAVSLDFLCGAGNNSLKEVPNMTILNTAFSDNCSSASNKTCTIINTRLVKYH